MSIKDADHGQGTDAAHAAHAEKINSDTSTALDRADAHLGEIMDTLGELRRGLAELERATLLVEARAAFGRQDTIN
jgi:hypothetical protein